MSEVVQFWFTCTHNTHLTFIQTEKQEDSIKIDHHVFACFLKKMCAHQTRLNDISTLSVSVMSFSITNFQMVLSS